MKVLWLVAEQNKFLGCAALIRLYRTHVRLFRALVCMLRMKTSSSHQPMVLVQIFPNLSPGRQLRCLQSLQSDNSYTGILGYIPRSSLINHGTSSAPVHLKPTLTGGCWLVRVRVRSVPSPREEECVWAAQWSLVTIEPSVTRALWSWIHDYKYIQIPTAAWPQVSPLCRGRTKNKT